MVYKLDSSLPAWIHQQNITEDEAAEILYQNSHRLNHPTVYALHGMAKRHLARKRQTHFVHIRYYNDAGPPFFLVSRSHAPAPLEFDSSDDDEEPITMDDIDDEDDYPEDLGYFETAV